MITPGMVIGFIAVEIILLHLGFSWLEHRRNKREYEAYVRMARIENVLEGRSQTLQKM